MSKRFATPYDAMKTRTLPFVGSANWALVLIALAVLWFGYRIIFIAIFNLWRQTPAVMVDPSQVDTFIAGSTPIAVCWGLASFAIYLGLILGIARTFHGISLNGLIGASWPASRQFGRVSLYLMPIYGVMFLPAIFEPEVFQNLSLSRWIFILPATLPLLFLQTSTEELVFRGYLQSHIAALTRHPILWMGLPSFLFGMAHLDPTSPTYSAWAYVIWATFFGLMCADLTARSGTLGPALALHFINNAFAVLFVASDDWLYGAALYVWPLYGQPWVPWIPYEALSLLVVWLAARIALRR